MYGIESNKPVSCNRSLHSETSGLIHPTQYWWMGTLCDPTKLHQCSWSFHLLESCHIYLFYDFIWTLANVLWFISVLLVWCAFKYLKNKTKKYFQNIFFLFPLIHLIWNLFMNAALLKHQTCRRPHQLWDNVKLFPRVPHGNKSMKSMNQKMTC